MNTSKLDLDELSFLLRHESLSASNFCIALVFASLYGRLHWSNNSGFLSDEELENSLFERWKNELRTVRRPDRVSGSWCHLLSRPYVSGGHTRLLRQLANGLDDCGQSQYMIVTQEVNAKTAASLPVALQNIIALKGNLAQRAQECLEAGLRAEVVVMHTHPDDIVAALAARAMRQLGTKVLFINHADHVFSFGHGAADAVLEISAIGWKATQLRRHAQAQHFMGIAIRSEKDELAAETTSRSGPILSIGSPVKYQPSTELNFANFLERLLCKVPNEVVLIGPKGTEAWWASLRARFPDRVQFMGVLPPNAIQQFYRRASCYVDSFPMEGGTAFPEAMSHGIAAFGLNRKSALGFSPADAVRCDGEDDLVAEIAEFLGGGPFPEKMRLARERIAREMSREATVRRLRASTQGQGAELPAYLAALGTSSLDYFAKSWEDKGQLVLPRKLWRLLPILTRIRLVQSVSRLQMSRRTSSELRKRILFG